MEEWYLKSQTRIALMVPRMGRMVDKVTVVVGNGPSRSMARPRTIGEVPWDLPIVQPVRRVCIVELMRGRVTGKAIAEFGGIIWHIS